MPGVKTGGKRLKTLKNVKNKFPKATGLWITGINPVKVALQAGNPGMQELLIARVDARSEELIESARRQGVPMRRTTREELTAVVGHMHHQGVALRASEYSYTALESILAHPLQQREPLVILDSIQDPQNLGAILRSACFLGAAALIIPKDRSASVTSTVIKVAAGATAHVPVVQVTNLARTLDMLKQAGLWIVGLAVQGSQPLYEADLSVPLGLVVGNEQKGIRPLLRKHCDLLVQIPNHGPLQSLNAATASAIALAEIQRQRAKNSH